MRQHSAHGRRCSPVETAHRLLAQRVDNHLVAVKQEICRIRRMSQTSQIRHGVDHIRNIKGYDLFLREHRFIITETIGYPCQPVDLSPEILRHRLQIVVRNDEI